MRLPRRLPLRAGSGRLLRYGGWTALILATVAVAIWSGSLRPADDALTSLRFGAASREASQSLTIVEIDSRSLQAGGTWPWDRARYAEAIDNLVDAGAVLVAFDVDFSAPSNPEADGALAAAISRHPGQVALATFVQGESFDAARRRIVANTPLEPLRRDALLASVNVPVDSDGKVRRYERGAPSLVYPSVAGLMAGGAAAGGDYLIDYGIDPATIDKISFEDILKRRFSPDAVRGRVVLVGATALELGDEFATPRGLLPGVVIHGLAYESLVSGRALMPLEPLVLLALCVLVGLLLLPARAGGRSLNALLVRHAIVGGLILGLPIVVQAIAPISLSFAALLLTQALFGLWATRVELSRRARAVIEEREASLRHQATRQSETSLPNRRALLSAVADRGSESSSTSMALVAVGVERHAEMRGVVGYTVANRLMVQLAERMSDLTGAVCVAHVATSVLAFCLSGLDSDDLDGLLLRLGALETNFNVDGHSIDIFLRIGAAMDVEGVVSPEVLMERATIALNRAQHAEGRVAVYDPDVFGSAINNLALMSEMREAMESGDISLYYQPKMKMADGSIGSVEALCRWRHPVRGFVSPDEFIPIAEETGQIRALTEWSLLQAVKDQARLREAGYDITVALNVSGRLLADEDFRAQALEVTRSIETKLCFEITETAVIQNPAMATDAITAYRAAGIQISIDDYGSGLSSLSYLKILNADELKIDRSLVVDVLESQRDRLIMKSTIDLAHGLGMSVVAEGVETEALAASLRLLGCDVVQGYWLSRALPFGQLIDFLGAQLSLKPTASADVRVAQLGR